MRARRVLLQLIAAAAFLLSHPVPLFDPTPRHFNGAEPAAVVSGGQCIQTGTACVATYPEVTVASIGTTICARHYTRDLRHKFANAIRKMRARLIGEAGLSFEASRSKILDHIIPLELGGHPIHASNLQLQDAAKSRRKDNVENRLHTLVCDGLVRLDDARAAIANDWQTALQARGL